MENQNLISIFAKIDALGVDGYFRHPASEKEMKLLVNGIQGREGVARSDLKAWFAWHNGQNTDQPCFMEGGRFLRIDEALNAWDYFLDPRNEFMEPYRRQWLPVQANATGDYLVFDLVSGCLINYWHDDDNREVEFKSMTELALRIEKSAAEMAAIPPRSDDRLIDLDPRSLSILIHPNVSGKNLTLCKEIRSLSGEPMIVVVKMLRAGNRDEALHVDLADAINGLERASDVRRAGTIFEKMLDAGVEPVLLLKHGSSFEKIDVSSLEKLSSRCTSL